MNIYGMSDLAILREVGNRIRQRRLQKNLSQQQLADKTGLNRATISELERGAPFGVLTLIQIIRALDALDEFVNFLPEPPPSPLLLAETRGKERLRASKKRKQPPKEPSTW